MNGETYWLTRISPVREAFSYKDWTAIGGLDPYGQHQLLWKLFSLPPKESNSPAPFLFRAEIQEGLPRFFVLSRVVPADASGKWLVEPVEYHPALVAGDRLSFKLRANPVVERHGGVVLGVDGQPKVRKSGPHAGKQKLKVTRHDVVMDAKQRMEWKTLPPDERPNLAHIAHEAGSFWLRERADSLGFQFDEASLRVDSHTVHRLKRHRDTNGKRHDIALGTLDFEGVLEVVDPTRFLSVLYDGIGPAKAFGCGLLLVRRAP